MANLFSEIAQKFSALPTGGKIAVIAGSAGVVLLIWQPWKSSSSSTTATTLANATPLAASSSGIASGVGTSMTGSSGIDPSTYTPNGGATWTATGGSAGTSTTGSSSLPASTASGSGSAVSQTGSLSSGTASGSSTSGSVATASTPPPIKIVNVAKPTVTQPLVLAANPSGQTFASASYANAVDSAGGLYQNHQWEPGHYTNGSFVDTGPTVAAGSTATSTVTTKPAVQQSVTPKTATVGSLITSSQPFNSPGRAQITSGGGNGFAIQNTVQASKPQLQLVRAASSTGKVSTSNSYNQAVDAAGGVWQNHKFVKGRYVGNKFVRS